MSAGAAAKSIDLDQWFDLYQAGTTKARAAGGGIAGANLSDRYANVIYGSQGPATGIYDKGVDICTLYAAKGTTNYPLPIQGANFLAQSQGTISSAMDSNINVQIKSDGTYSVTVQGNGASNTPSTSGTWLPTGASISDYQVEFGWSQTSQYPTGPATVTNGASTYQACTTTRAVVFDAEVGQHTGGDQGSVGTVTINLKYVPTGKVTTTTFGINIESQGSA